MQREALHGIDGARSSASIITDENGSGGARHHDAKVDFDGLDIEDWLLKHLEIARQYNANNDEAAVEPRAFLAAYGDRPRRQQGEKSISDIEEGSSKGPPAGLRSGKPSHHSSVFGLQEGRTAFVEPVGEGGNFEASRLLLGGQQTRSDRGILLPSTGNGGASEPSLVVFHDSDGMIATMYAETTHTAKDMFIVEVLSTPDKPVLIEGVMVLKTPMLRRLCFLVGLLVTTACVTFVAYLIATRLTTSWSDSTNLDSSPPNSTNLMMNTTGSSSQERVGYHVNQTIAEGIEEAESKGASVSAFMLPVTSKLFRDLVGRLDTNFTLFGISPQAKLLEGLDLSSILTKVVSPKWICHMLDALEGFVIEGQVVSTDDMYDGMILTSKSGYPLTIRLDPIFRVNNSTMSVDERNLYHLNGIVHNSVKYPSPFVPWLSKSNFDMLVEANIRRKGDLSSFIALVDAIPDLKVQLQVGGGITATTIFVPTNDALATVSMSLLADPISLQRLLENHMVSRNFAIRFWSIIPSEDDDRSKVSNTELKLVTQAGQVLDLQFNDNGMVIIDGNAMIIQGDIFSEDGILHVIDKPLLSL